MLDKVKIIVIGPRGGGKTTVSNILADATEVSSDYRPTEGVRILEFESQEIPMKPHSEKVDVELWDCSGNEKFSNYWPAMRKDAKGVIFIYTGKTESHINEMQKLYENFVQQLKLGPKNCVVFHLDFGNKFDGFNPRINPVFSRVSQVNYKIESEGERLKEDFNAFLKTIVTSIRE